MWTAAPLENLNPELIRAWDEGGGLDMPLAQTRAWAQATRALGARCIWVGSLEDQASGMVYELPHEPGVFQCQNGPLLHWDDPGRAVKELAQFARALSVFAGSSFRELRIRPRLLQTEWSTRMKGFPLDAARVEFASTTQVSICASAHELMARFSPRLRRSVMKTFAQEPETDWIVVDRDNGPDLAESARLFGKRKGFFVPPWEWFGALIEAQQEGVTFLRVAQVRVGLSTARAWIWIDRSSAYYLYGDYSGPRLKSGINLGAAVQVVAMLGAASEGATRYDFNGFVRDTAANPDYAGVSAFKAQFLGEIIDYAVPEFVIQG